MRRILVVSRSPTMAVSLGHKRYDVVDLRPAALSSWLRQGHGPADAVVVDLDTPAETLATVAELRSKLPRAPILVVTADVDRDAVDLREHPGVHALPLPVTRTVLLATLRRLLGRSLRRPPPVIRASTPTATGRRAVRHRGEALPAAEPAEPAETAAVEDTGAGDDPAPQPDPPSELAPVPDAADGRPGPDNPLPTEEQVPGGDDPAPAQHRVAAAAVDRYVLPAVADLVRHLTARIDDVFGVNDTAQVVAAQVVEQAGADAGALLLPDGGRWRVAGAVGLRPLEQRYELARDAWLVSRVAASHRGLIIEESDIVRRELHGAPLAHWRHLMAVPVLVVEGVVLLARTATPFTEAELALAARLATDAGPPLAAAIEVRRLARLLEPFAERGD